MSMNEEGIRFGLKSWRYWSMYFTSIAILVFPTLLITLGLSGLFSTIIVGDQTELMPPSALIASFAVCGMSVRIDEKKRIQEKI